MKIDDSWNRYYGKPSSDGYRRYAYSVSHLFGNVLDVGCGDGFGAWLMTKNKNIEQITCIDSQAEAVKRATKNLLNLPVDIIKIDAERLPFPDNTFDSVHCGQTLEHVRNDVKVIQEIRRVVKNRAVFSVPINGGLSDQHKREYRNEQGFVNLISKYFRVVKIKEFVDKKKQLRVVLVADK